MGGGGDQGEGRGGGGGERNLSTPPTSTFGETERVFYQHKTVKQKEFLFLTQHKLSWSPGNHTRNSKQRVKMALSALKVGRGKERPQTYDLQPGPE